MSSLDLTKQLKLAPITDIDKRFASTDNLLETYTTDLSNDKTNTFTFQDTAQVNAPLKPDKITNDDVISPSVLSPEILSSFTKALGYQPQNTDDITKAIDKISTDLKDTLNKSLSWLFNTNTQDFKPITFKSFSDSTKNKLSSSDKFKSIYITDKKSNTTILNKLSNNKSFFQNKYEDIDVNNILKSNKDFNFLDDINADGVSSFISDSTTSEYLSANSSPSILNDIKNLMSSTLKYATDICNDLVDILNTMITDIGNLINAIIKFLTNAIDNDSFMFLSDILKCFNKLNNIIFKPDNTQYITKQIEKKGSLGSLEVLFKQNKSDKINYKKALYNTTKNASDIDPTLYQSIKSTYNIQDNGFITLESNNSSLSSNKSILDQLSDPVFNITKVNNNNLSTAILSQNNKDDSDSSSFLQSIPLITAI